MSGAVVGVGVTEVVTGVMGDPSVVLAVGNRVIEAVPGDVAVRAIDAFGSNNKRVLTACLFVGAAALGALAGRAAGARWTRFAPPVAIAAVLGWIASTQESDANGVVAAIAVTVAALAAVATHLGIHLAASPGRVSPTTDSPAAPHHDRRSVLGAGGTAIAGGAALTLGGRWLRGRSTNAENLELAARQLDLSSATTLPPEPGLATENAKISSFITPNDRFYKIDTTLFTPRVDLDTWRLTITGMVENDLELSFSDLTEFERVERTVTLSCVSNPVGGPLVGNAVWTGIPLSTLLDAAGVKEGADQIASRSVDNWSCGFPTEFAYDGREALLALTMNGVALPPDHGFPARLVVAGLYGFVSATKWIREIELTTWEGFDGYWVPRGWSKTGPIKTQSRIDTPSNGEVISGETLAIGGVAWAPNVGIESVEVRLDGGEWVEADLGDGTNDDAWRQWILRMPTSDLAPGAHAIQVRAADRSGSTQTGDLADVIPDGATGWHTIAIEIRS